MHVIIAYTQRVQRVEQGSTLTWLCKRWVIEEERDGGYYMKDKRYMYIENFKQRKSIEI